MDRTCFGSTTDDYTGAVKCKIVGVSFSYGKVLYDVALFFNESPTSYYEELPLRNVDSVLVLPLLGQVT